MATSKAYGLALKSFVTKQIDFSGGTVKAMLLASTYVPNQDTHQFKSDLAGEITGTGYTAGGVTLTNKSVTWTAASKTLTLTSDNPTWAGAAFTCRYLVFYQDTGTATTSPLIAYVDFVSDQSPASQDFTYLIPTTGILQLVAS